MVKILRAAAYELGKARARIEDLEKDNKELRLEVLALKARLVKYEVLDSSSARPVRSQHDKPPKRYEQGTAASRNRSVKDGADQSIPPPQRTLKIAGSHYSYEDGALITAKLSTDFSWPEVDHHYQRSTFSTWNKQKPRNSHRMWNDTPQSGHSGGWMSDGTSTAVGSEDSAVRIWDKNPTWPTEEISAVAQETSVIAHDAESYFEKYHFFPPHRTPPLNVHMLEERSRLRESSWLG